MYMHVYTTSLSISLFHTHTHIRCGCGTRGQTRRRVNTNLYICVCKHIYTYRAIERDIYQCMYRCAYIHISIDMCMYMYVHTNSRYRSLSHTHTHTSDAVVGPEGKQEDVYNASAKPVVDDFLEVAKKKSAKKKNEHFIPSQEFCMTSKKRALNSN